MNTKATFVLALSSLLFSSSVGYGEGVPLRSIDINEEISFEHAWERFLKVCGLAVSDPSGYLATLPEKGILGEKVRTKHEDGKLTTIDIQNGRIMESVVIARIGINVDIDCHFHFERPNNAGVEEFARLFLKIIKTEPDWEYAGGYGERHFPSVWGGRGHVCAFRSIRTSIPTASGQPFRSIRTRLRLAAEPIL